MFSIAWIGIRIQRNGGSAEASVIDKNSVEISFDVGIDYGVRVDATSLAIPEIGYEKSRTYIETGTPFEEYTYCLIDVGKQLSKDTEYTYNNYNRFLLSTAWNPLDIRESSRY